jgi:hypothetical protein
MHTICVFLEGASYAPILRHYCQEQGWQIDSDTENEIHWILDVPAGQVVMVIAELRSCFWVTDACLEPFS